ncbi:MAG: hypothetical protein KJ072_28395 [Verrucomicrobia bacterium]|nr:hypothetical protein [Verrucomicrobiota bacterium]
MDPIDTRCWARHPRLFWSNPRAGEVVGIRRVLLRPRFGRLLDIALRFGLDRFRREWNELEADATPGVCLGRPTSEAILRNLETGLAATAARAHPPGQDYSPG